MAVSEFITKQCSKCKGHKPFAEFGKQAHRKDGYRPWCKSCTNRGIYAKREENWSVFLDQERQRYHASIDKQQARSRSYRSKNPDKVRAASNSYRKRNIEKYNAVSRLWAKENVDRHRANRAKRRSAEMKATPNWADFDAILLIYGAARKAEKEDGISRHVDHMVPLQSKIVCGLHNEFNLQILLDGDNRSKGNRYWPDMP